MAADARSSVRRAGRRALQALTAAALALPGLAAAGHAQAADGEDFSFQYSRYQESPRDLYGRSYAGLNLKPLEVDSLATSTRFEVGNRFRLGLDYSQDTWSGATPVVTLPVAAVREQLSSGASSPNHYYEDLKHVPVLVDWNRCDPVTGKCATVRDRRLVDLMGSASPETRRQAVLNLGYDWNNAGLTLGVGASDEPDYRSRFLSLSGTVDLDHKLTTVSWGASFTADRIEASLAANTAADWSLFQSSIFERDGTPTLFGRRRDIAFNLGLTRVVNRGALLEAGVMVTRSSGMLEDPYKAVMFAFDDPAQRPYHTGMLFVRMQGVLEQRPDQRDQLSLNLRYVQHIGATDAALHLEYRLFADDWGITAHTLDASFDQPLGGGWMVTPQARYYSQSAARFYRPYFVLPQAFPGHIGGGPLDWSQIALTEFSSDERLSAFGAVSGGLSISKTLSDGMTLEAGYEYYLHKGALKLGGGGEGGFGDFNAWTLHAGFRFDLAARKGRRAEAFAASGDDGVVVDSGALLPAGVRFGEVLSRAGALAFDLRYDGSAQGGPLRIGGLALADDQAIIDHACGASSCMTVPSAYDARSIMAEARYAVTRALTLLVAPRLVDRTVDLRLLQPTFFGPIGPVGPRLTDDGRGRHATGGLGDTDIVALLRVTERPGWSLTAGLGVSAPTGGAGIRRNTSPDYGPYAMQLGSGTWDLLPSLTFTAREGRGTIGAQVSGVKRLQASGPDGYALGDRFQATAWAGFKVFDWLSLTARGAYSDQGAIRGQYKPHFETNVPFIEEVQADWDVNGDGVIDARDTYETTVFRDAFVPHAVSSSLDLPGDYGGRAWDVGLGATLVIPAGALKGDLISVEWLQPVKTQARGYQLSRGPTLSLRFGFGF